MCAIKVTHVQTSLPLTGNAAYRLHLKMIDCGINSKMLHLKSSFIDDKINVLINNKHIVSFKYMVHSCVNRIYLRLKRKESYAEQKSAAKIGACDLAGCADPRRLGAGRTHTYGYRAE